MSYKLKYAALASAALGAFLLSPVAGNAQKAVEITEASATDPSSKADPDMAKVLAALAALDPKPIENLSPADARKQPSAADAAKKVIKERN